MREFESSHSSHPVRDLKNFSHGCEKAPPVAGFSCEVILYGDRFSANLTEIGQYSPTLTQNIPVFREPKPETGSIALSAGQNGDKFPSQLRYLSVRQHVRF